MSNIRFYLILSLIIIILAFAFAITENKVDILELINKNNSKELDFFFKYYTYLGSGMFLALVGLYAYYKEKFIFYTIILTAILLLIFVNLTKIIAKAPRPIAFYEQKEINTSHLHFVEGEKLHRSYSFPSGHSATAMATFTLLALCFAQKKPLLQLLFLAMALTVAYSRLYLFQHFFVDVVVGVAIGLFSVTISYFFFKYILKVEYKKTSKTVRI